MLIVPVIDISRGCVVHARRGERAAYLPVQSQLCKGSNPVDIVESFINLGHFDRVYIADLDAISRTGNNMDVINAIHRQFPHLILWLDNGGMDITKSPDSAAVPVIGSETGISLQQLAAINRHETDYVLSLDFTDNGLKGDAGLLNSASLWPQDVIVLNMARTGTALGPDYALIRHIHGIAGGRRLYCGGGIRSADDLQQLAEAGCRGVLLATALHNRTITTDIIRELQD